MEHYVYVLYRPWNGLPCYVGKGKEDRWQVHERLGGKHPNKNLANIFKKAGGSLPKEKVMEALSDEDAVKFERILIAAIGRKKDGGPLVNQTDGGDGVSGFVHSEETKQRLSVALMGREVSEATRIAVSKRHKGKFVSEETRKRMSAQMSDRVLSEEHKKKISVGLLASGREYRFSEEHRRKISEAKTGKKLSEEHKAKIGLAGIGRKQSPETIAKRAASVKRFHENKKKNDG